MGHRAQGTERKVDFKMFIVYTPCGIHPSIHLIPSWLQRGDYGISIRRLGFE